MGFARLAARTGFRPVLAAQRHATLIFRVPSFPVVVKHVTGHPHAQKTIFPRLNFETFESRPKKPKSSVSAAVWASSMLAVTTVIPSLAHCDSGSEAGGFDLSPVAVAYESLLSFHDLSGLSWGGSIVAFALLFRLSILPLTVFIAYWALFNKKICPDISDALCCEIRHDHATACRDL